MMPSIRSNIFQIMDNIRESALLSGRNAGAVKLMAVTKTVAPERIREAIAAGISLLGGNYVQETAEKKAALEREGCHAEWHMIGRLQTNKARQAVRLFSLIHSVDRLELAQEIAKRSQALGGVARVLIEVNTGAEPTKSGVPLARAIELTTTLARLEHISIQGLMTIPPWFDDPEKARPYFIALRKLKEEIDCLKIPGVTMQELSMGMTDDYPIAIAEGATIVRIGRGIFGERQKQISR